MRGSGQTDHKLPVIQVAHRTCQGQFTHYRLVEGFEFWKFFAVERGGARERSNMEQLSRVKAPARVSRNRPRTQTAHREKERFLMI